MKTNIRMNRPVPGTEEPAAGIHVLPVNDKYLLYSPGRDLYALLNKKALLSVKQYLSEQKIPAQSQLEQLCLRLNQPPSLRVSKPGNQFDPCFLGIIPTRACNSRCVYCDFGTGTINGKSLGRPMDSQTATAALDWYADYTVQTGKDSLEIHFFGGEPMAGIDIVELVAHRARMISHQNSLDLKLVITTNGQYDAATAKFLADYFHTVVLSLDGPDEFQDWLRPRKDGQKSSVFAKRTARIIGESGADLNLRCCISSLNQGKMESIAAWFADNFNPTHINFEIMQPGRSSAVQEQGIVPPDPYLFSASFIRARLLLKAYGINAVYGSDLSETIQQTSCPVGKDSMIVSPDGRISSCYLFPDRWQAKHLDLDIGSVRGSAVTLWDEKIMSIRTLVEQKPRCVNCFCNLSCSGGCHVEQTFPGCSKIYSDFCIQTRLISTCSILEKLDCISEIETLLGSRTNMETLALQSSDHIMEIR